MIAVDKFVDSGNIVAVGSGEMVIPLRSKGLT